MRLHGRSYRGYGEFDGIFDCEFCGHSATLKKCIDDPDLHERVIPYMKCSYCHQSSLGPPVEGLWDTMKPRSEGATT